ncbi:MAG: putative integral rane protein [Deltaproteobacteria bacterium]|nr:putative integral rane protein [Deltaproteobacteria bacterium]
MSNPLLLVYLPYATIAVTLTIWLARALARHGEVFLRDVFPGRVELACAINQLLVIGFYLVNLGWALLLLRASGTQVDGIAGAIALLTSRLGTLLLLLGAAHLTNLYVFHRVRQAAQNAASMAATMAPAK